MEDGHGFLVTSSLVGKVLKREVIREGKEMPVFVRRVREEKET